MKIESEFVGNDGTTTKGIYNKMIAGRYGVEYGVVGDTLNAIPDSRTASCGKYGDNQTNTNFFSSLEEANSYAKTKGLRVNAMRVYVEKAYTEGYLWLGQFSIKVLKSDLSSPRFDMETSATADEWSSEKRNYPDFIRAGLLRPQLSVDSSSVQIDQKATVELTPVSYNNDTNASIAVTIPKGLSLVGGSVSQSGNALTEGTDFTVTVNDDGTTALTFSGKSVAGSEPTYDNDGIPTAADNGGNGIERSPITFDVLAGSDIATPSTLTLSAISSGDGTNSTVDKFRKSTIDLMVTAPSKGFGYSLNANKASANSGEEIDYTMTVRNTTDSVTDDNGVDMINILPYSGDSRGTTNIASYKVNDLSISSSGVSNLTMWYTTDEDVRKIDVATSVDEIKDIGRGISWRQCGA